MLLRHCYDIHNQNTIVTWTKVCILSFPKKGDLGLAKNFQGILLTSIAAKIYNAVLRTRKEPKIEKILRKTKTAFGEIDTHITNVDYPSNSRGVCAKTLR